MTAKDIEVSGSTAELGDVLKESFGVFAEYVVLHRAIPDIRDGLKPVQRRLIFGAWEMGARVPNKLVKCAKIVGQVMGNYHPHGDASIYDALVKLVQPFNMAIPLFEGQGNFGTLEDGAAAPRYTEARLNKIAQELCCNNLNPEVVSYIPNYDESAQEPEVLPTELPHVLLNPNSGIAVGIATDMLSCAPHEIIDCLIGEIDEELVTKHSEFAPKNFKGPDLPTGGIIEFDKDQINLMWMTGHSRWKLRGETAFETDESSGTRRVIIKSLPYMQKKGQWLDKTARLAEEKTAEGARVFDIRDMRDESNEKVGTRIVFEPGRGSNSETIQNILYKKTRLQQHINTNMIALVDGRVQYVGVRDCMLYWLDFRRECIRKILNKEKREKEERIEIIEGLLKVHANIEEVIKVIRKAENTKEALIKKFGFTDRQVDAVVAMRLGQLRRLDEDSLKTEDKELKARVSEIIEILKDPKKVDALIKERLLWWKDQLPERRTKIVREFGEITTMDTVIEQDVVVSINNRDEVKLTDVHAYRKVRRGGAGVKETKDDDPDSIPRLVAQVTTHDTLYAFTNKSRVFEKVCCDLPITKRRGKAFALTELFPNLEEDERVVSILTMDPLNVADDDSIIILRSNGNVKRLSCKGLPKKRGKLNGEECCRTNQDDSKLVDVTFAPKDEDLILFTKNGAYRRITVDSIRMLPTRASGAVKCLLLTGDDEVIGLDSIKSEDTVVSVSANGFGARFNESKLPHKKGRMGKGMKLANADSKSGNIVYGGVLRNGDELFLTTSGGKSLRVAVDGIREIGRGSRGVKLQKLGKDEEVVAVTKISSEE